MMIRMLQIPLAVGFLLTGAVLSTSAEAAIEILSPESTRTFYAQAIGVGHGPTVTIPALSTASPTNWISTSPNLSWNATVNAYHDGSGAGFPTEVSTSNNDISLFVNNSSQLVMSIDSTHTRTANATQAGYFGIGNEGIFFTVDDPAGTPFSFSGAYGPTGTPSATGFSAFASHLTLAGAPNTNYFNYSQSSIGAYNYSENAAGVLPPGTYQWYMFSRIAFAGRGDSGGGSAEGNFTLILGAPREPGVVPEATSVLAWGGLAMTALIINRSRRGRSGL
jgi:hypothetical protein